MSILKLIKGGKPETDDTEKVEEAETVTIPHDTFAGLPSGIPSLSDPLSDLDEARQAVEALWVFLEEIDPTAMLEPIKAKRPRTALETVKLLKWGHELREKVQEWKQELKTLDEVIGFKHRGGER